MSTEWELPGWAKDMHYPPTLNTYTGPEGLAIPWEGGISRRRFAISVDPDFVLDLNAAQAEALRDMLDMALESPVLMRMDPSFKEGITEVPE